MILNFTPKILGSSNKILRSRIPIGCENVLALAVMVLQNDHELEQLTLLVPHHRPSRIGAWYKEVTPPITYLEVRFVAPK
jgi:hypothetical protein